METPVPVRALRRLLAPVTRTGFFRRTVHLWLPRAERGLAKITGGRLQVSGILVPSLVLHTIGARSGRPRETVLMFTPDEHGGVILAGTNFARTQHPAWTYNLLAHPDAEVSIHGRRYAVRSSPIEDDLRDATWRLLERQWPGYRAYERDSGRTVRLFRLQLATRSSCGTSRSPASHWSCSWCGFRRT